MSNGFALWKKNSRDLEWGRLTLDDRASLTLETESASATVEFDATTSPYVDVYVHDDWLCAVGGADRGLVIGHRNPVRLGSAAELDRLGTRGDGFEFGTHSVRFHDRQGHNQCVLAWEFGVALVDPGIGVVWAYEHHDVNQRLLRITADTVELPCWIFVGVTGVIVYLVMLTDVLTWILKALAWQGVFVTAWVAIAAVYVLRAKSQRRPPRNQPSTWA